MNEQHELGSLVLPNGTFPARFFGMTPAKAYLLVYLDMMLKVNPNHLGLPPLERIAADTHLGMTILRRYVKELNAEGVLERSAYHFYKVNRTRLIELYYPSQSEGSGNPSQSDASLCEPFNNSISTSVQNNDMVKIKDKELSTRGNPSQSDASESEGSTTNPSGSIQSAAGGSPSGSLQGVPSALQEIIKELENTPVDPKIASIVPPKGSSAAKGAKEAPMLGSAASTSTKGKKPRIAPPVKEFKVPDDVEGYLNRTLAKWSSAPGISDAVRQKRKEALSSKLHFCSSLADAHGVVTAIEYTKFEEAV